MKILCCLRGKDLEDLGCKQHVIQCVLEFSSNFQGSITNNLANHIQANQTQNIVRNMKEGGLKLKVSDFEDDGR